MRKTSFWQSLQNTSKPVFIYGTGNGADKIIDILERTGVNITGVFASDGFVRNRSFRGFQVKSYGSIRSEYGDDIVVLAAFGSALSEILDFLAVLDQRHELYVPEVPLFCENLFSELFDDAFYNMHKEELTEAEGLFSDAESVLLFRDMISHRLTGKLHYLSRTENPAESVSTLLDCENIRYAIDGGAFKGDTVSMFCGLFPNLEAIAAAEPDPRSYKKLAEMAAARNSPNVIPINAMLDDSTGIRDFASSGSRGSSTNASSLSLKRTKKIRVASISIDDIVQDKLSGKIDFLKLDTEGYELEALNGASCALHKRPALSVSLYHRSADIYALPLLLRRYYPDGKFYLRRPLCVPEWDLTLYVTN